MANISDCFDMNFVFLKIFGLWSGRKPSKYYKYYSIIYLFITLPIYILFLTLNLMYTPREIELIIRELIYYFTECSMLAKVYMILIKRNKLLEAFSILNCEAFKGDDDVTSEIVNKHVTKYKTYWKFYAILSNFAYASQMILPVFLHFIFKTNIELPVCKYYFLDEEIVERYFVLLWFYQAIGIYGHMTYNINVDTMISGMVFMAIAEVEVVNHEIGVKITAVEKGVTENQEESLKLKLNKYLKHYELVLIYTSAIQDIISVTMFLHFGVASAIICAALCRVSLSASTELMLFLAPYLFVMILQIFVPAYLGTQLSYKSNELVNAAYSSKWIHRSESFKSSLKLFMQRADKEILLTGCGLFPLTLDTFTSIMKSAYSFFALVRSFQNRGN